MDRGWPGEWQARRGKWPKFKLVSMRHGLLHWIGVIMCSNKVVPQLMAMAQGGMEEKWNPAQVREGIKKKSFFFRKKS